MRSVLFITSLVSCVVTGCAPAVITPPSKTVAGGVRMVHYTPAQKTSLTYCLGLADTAWSIATMKLAGQTRAVAMMDAWNTCMDPMVTR